MVRWIYVVVAAHLAAGILLPCLAGGAWLDGYRRQMAQFFIGAQAPAGVQALQAWWISLFGPTVQAAALWMAGLAVMGDKQRNAFAWVMLIVGLLVWAPQDMLISARASNWTNVWIDAGALLLMLPPLLRLCVLDLGARRTAS